MKTATMFDEFFCKHKRLRRRFPIINVFELVCCSKVCQRYLSSVSSAVISELEAANIDPRLLPSGRSLLKMRLGRTSRNEFQANERVFAETGLKFQTTISTLQLDASMHIDYIHIADFARSLCLSGCQSLLVGYVNATWHEFRCRCALFWKLYEHMDGTHPVYATENKHRLEQTVPIFVYGDEGRGLKKNPVLSVTWEPCMGRGVKENIDKPDVLGVNMKGSSYVTRFLFTLVANTAYKNSVAAWDKIFAQLALSCKDVFENGIRCPGNRNIFFATIGLKGDLPFLGKVGHFCRNFNRLTDSSHTGAGICHLCLGGTPGNLWEDLSPVAQWIHSEFDCEEPWTTPGPLADIPQGLNKPRFFKFDLFHLVHKGVGADLASSIIILLASKGAYGSTGDFESKLNAAYLEFKSFCISIKKRPNLNKFTRGCFSYSNVNCFPRGEWFKGDDTHLLLKWLDACVRANLARCDGLNETLSIEIIQAVSGLNKFMDTLYKADLFLPKAVTGLAVRAGELFLKSYSKCVSIGLSMEICMFGLRPKHHFFHHIVQLLRWQYEIGVDAWNPLAESVQMNEDFVGKSCRLTRRGGTRENIKIAISNYLIAVQKQLNAVLSCQ